MALVRQFCFDHGLLGSNTKSSDDVAIAIRMASCRAKPIACGFASTPRTCRLAAEGKALETMSAGFFAIHAKPGRIDGAGAVLVLFAAGVEPVSLRRADAASRESGRPRDADHCADGQRDVRRGAEAGRGRRSRWPRARPGAEPFVSSMLWKDTKATARRFVYSMAAADSGRAAGAAHGAVSLCRGVLSALRAVLRQDRRALAAADSVHRVRHR